MSILQRESWEDIPDLNLDILRGIYAIGFEKPSAIQGKAIEPIMKKDNVIAQAQSGTGKTGAFTIGGLHLIDTKKRYSIIDFITY